MTTKEIIDTLEVAIAEVEWNYPMDYAVAFEEAITGLKKQIPIEPTVYKSSPKDIALCRLCGSSFVEGQYARMNYCPNCGQRQMWEEDNVEES